MIEKGFKRKLTAILSADVIGYSRLMRDDEEATVRDIATHRALIIVVASSLTIWNYYLRAQIEPASKDQAVLERLFSGLRKAGLK